MEIRINNQDQSDNNVQEIWKDVRGYEGLYQVSNLGRVRSLDRCLTNKNGVTRICRGRVLKPQDDTHGYRIVSFGRKNHKKVHRLVAGAFCDNPNPRKFNVVNHKDSNTSNNKASNLEWCTQAYNMAYGLLRQKQVEAQSKAVAQYTKDGTLIKVYPSLRGASRETGINKWNIFTSCKTGKKTAGGFLWKRV